MQKNEAQWRNNNVVRMRTSDGEITRETQNTNLIRKEAGLIVSY